MKYVHTIRRITALDKAIRKAPNTEKYDDILDALFDKRDMLVSHLKQYIRCPDRTDYELRKAYYYRRKQLQLACKLLNVDYYRVMR